MLEAGCGEPIEVQLTRGVGDGTDITRRLLADGCRDIAVLGGDGTIGEVVAGCVRPDGEGMVRDDIVLSVIHQGTGGDLARGLGIPKDEDGAIAVAAGRESRRVDVGVAFLENGRLARGFVSTANVGMAADVVERVAGRLKRLGNSGAFAVATIGCLARNRTRSVQLAIDGEDATPVDVVDIDVCNNGYMGGGMRVAPNAAIDDGTFDVVVISAAGRLKLLRTFPKIYSGRHVDDPLVRVTRAKSLSVRTGGGALEQGVVLDGELVGRTPVEFRVLPAAVSIRVPARASAGSIGSRP